MCANPIPACLPSLCTPLIRSGALTKLMVSMGLQVVGVDLDVSAAQRRGLQAVPLAPGAARHLSLGSLRGARPLVPGAKFDVVLVSRTHGGSVRVRGGGKLTRQA